MCDNDILLLIIAASNIISAVFARFLANPCRVKVYEGEDAGGGKRAFLIAGPLSQPGAAFRYIQLPGYTRVAVYFTAFGFNPEKVSHWLLGSVHMKRDVILAVSVGAKAVPARRRQILINPCIKRKDLKIKYRRMIIAMLPLAQLMSYLLGWLAFLPVIPAEEGHYSVALLVDQFWFMIFGDYEDQMGLAQTDFEVIVSEHDEFLRGCALKRRYMKYLPRAKMAVIDSQHARLGDPDEAPKYQEAIDVFLREGQS